MQMLQQFILPAMSFGASAATIPGPLIAYLVNTTLMRGWRKALLVVLAPLLTDAPIIILMTFILVQMPAEILNLLQFGGGCLLLFIARGAYRQYRAGTSLTLADGNADDTAHSSRRVLLTGVMMNFMSPGPWLFWGTVNGPLLVDALARSSIHAAVFLLAFYGVFLGGLCLWVLLFHNARRVRVEYLRYVILATVLLLLWFGIGLITAAIGMDQYHPLIVAAVVAAALVRARLSSP